MRILSFYLPQYHEIEENNKWWGKGYTEWSAVKRAKPLFLGHNQPKVPLNNNYYDLSDDTGEIWKWQAELAKQFGVYGFCVYHYWFGSKMLLQKPLEVLLNHPEIELNYSICWANESWTRTWYGKQSDIIIEQTYGDEYHWRKHFDYLVKFFCDSRYIKIDNKPVLHIYHTIDITKFKEMRNLWDNLAKGYGFSGIYYVSGMTGYLIDNRDLFDAYYCFEPGYSLKHSDNMFFDLKYEISTALRIINNKLFRCEKLERKIDIRKIYRLIEKRKVCENVLLGTFPMWDNTPRRGNKGLVYEHSSAELFKLHLKKLKEKARNSTVDFVYINAWNEWGEGAYLEPDEENKYDYLSALKDVMIGD